MKIFIGLFTGALTLIISNSAILAKESNQWINNEKLRSSYENSSFAVTNPTSFSPTNTRIFCNVFPPYNKGFCQILDNFCFLAKR